MKVGILTFWKTEDNYGQLLQCFALQHYLRSLGYETFLLRTDDVNLSNLTFKHKILAVGRTIYRLRLYPVYLLKEIVNSFFRTGIFFEDKIDLKFEEFRKKYLHCSRVYTLRELLQNPPRTDVFIVGSDQIWNTTSGTYFLSWDKSAAKK